MESFEAIAGLLEGMPAPADAEHLRVEWLTAHNVGVGRDHHGRPCVLLSGPALSATLPSVQRAIRHGTWKTERERLVEATLLSLPIGEQFLTAVAAIAAELLRRGAAHRPMGDVFTEVEEFVALVLRRVLLPPEFVIGLVGELIILSELLKASRVAGRATDDPTALWRGWMRQGRDFLLGEAAIEVKTTGLDVSRHHIHGLEQIEARRLDGAAVERLFLGSLGLRRAASGPYSVAGLTEQILRHLAIDGATGDALNDAQVKFLERLAQYGPEDSTGYVHSQMSDVDAYVEPYATTFAPRFYDMNDANVRVIRSSDLAESFQYVRAEGLACTIELPPRIPGSIDNPRADFRQLLRTLVAATPPPDPRPTEK